MVDILLDATPEEFLDDLGFLVSDLKQNNSSMKINVHCQIVLILMSPEIQAKIEDYNEKLEKKG